MNPTIAPQPRRIAIIGAGGHARSVANFCQDLGHTIVGLLDDDPALYATSFAGYDILGPPEMVADMAIDGAIVAIGDNAARKRHFDRLVAQGIPLVSVIHPRAYVARDVEIGQGVVVMPLAAVNAGSNVGDNAIVSLQAVVSHECHIASHGHVGANACLCGRVALSEGAFVGAGATVIPLKRIGAWSTVGAGATVVQDVPAKVIVTGVPARVLRKL